MPIRNPLGLGPGLLPAAGFQGGYLNKVLSIESDNLIGVWLQNELSGSVSFDRSGKGHNGAYTGVTLGGAGVPGMGLTSPLYDGANDFNNIYSAGLNADFDGAEGTQITWVQVANAGVWTDSTLRFLTAIVVDGNNFIQMFREATNGFVGFIYKAGGTEESQFTAGMSTVGWFNMAITWSKTGDTVIYYIDGATTGSADTGLGTWAGNIGPATTCIGSLNTTPASVWHGSIGPALLWNKALTADQIAYLSKV